MTVRLAVDCMGGDFGLNTTLPAVLSFISHHPDVSITLVGQRQLVDAELRRLGALAHPKISLVDASEVVAMSDSVETALRRKKDSSMRVAVNLVKDQQADACISAGNTGALMAVSRYVLKMLDGIDRPAIATALPNEKGGATTVLDLGANADCEPIHLLQFAQMADALVSTLEGKIRPTIGLLNIGEEAIKGSDVVKQAAELLRQSTLNFYGNVEGNDIFKGTTDIVVCDGFVGNITLKATEGLAKMIAGMMREEFNRSWWSKLLGLLALPVLQRFRARVDHRRYNGAALMGLRGLVIKSHGSADAYAFEWALKRAYDGVKNKTIERIATTFARLITPDTLFLSTPHTHDANKGSAT